MLSKATSIKDALLPEPTRPKTKPKEMQLQTIWLINNTLTVCNF